ncbi:MAG: class I SAM-dependent methyltransferase [Verrucomicrobia bacterium]|nr:class I SAM-dependent methyltransferase [Verrucomicrobiota bacterium]
MAEFHFVEDYERFVADLIKSHPLDEAMSLAVGGNYEEFGNVEADIMLYAGLKNGMSLLDFGCGSGRLASVLGRSTKIDYTGIDVVQPLLDYAKSRSPAHYRFLLNRSLSMPTGDNAHDFVSAFSVFTHLLPAESYIYLEDIKRTLKPDGKLVFSFLEFMTASQWAAFQVTVDALKHEAKAPLVTFMERSVIDVWCTRLGYVVQDYITGTEAPWGGSPLWQSVAILKKN